MNTKAIANANTNTLFFSFSFLFFLVFFFFFGFLFCFVFFVFLFFCFFYFKVLPANKLRVACRRESHVIISQSYLFTFSRPSLVLNVESNVTDVTNLRCKVERQVSMVPQIAGFVGYKQQRRQYSDKLGSYS